MKKNIIFFVFFILILAGCAHPVKHKLYKKYSNVRPRTIAVLPVGGDVDSYRVKSLFRSNTIERLTEAGYKVMDPDETDDVFLKELRKSTKRMTPAQLAAILPTDAVVYIYITDFDKDKVFGYASLSFGARFKLISHSGDLLWKGKHKSKETGLGFDKKTLELGVLEAYEARIERLVDDVVSTLPGPDIAKAAGGKEKEKEEEKKEFFQWLP